MSVTYVHNQCRYKYNILANFIVPFIWKSKGYSGRHPTTNLLILVNEDPARYLLRTVLSGGIS